jgi:hypothetical protein
MRGRFITFEGGEGTGKSTHSILLSDRLEALGIDVVLTREPGGSPGAEVIRHVLLSGVAKPFGVKAEALLFAAARDDHVRTTIEPALARGAWVICDRFIDSTRVYQGALGNLGTALTGDGKSPGIVQKVDLLVTENRENIQKTTGNLADITAKVNKGEGTLGKLVNDTKLHDELVAALADIRSGANEAKSFVANAQSIIDEVKKGKGAIGALVFDEKVGDDIKSTVATLREVSDKISKGQGTLGKLINDDSMLRDAQAIMKKADRALDGLDDTGPITAVGVVAKGLF